MTVAAVPPPLSGAHDVALDGVSGIVVAGLGFHAGGTDGVDLLAQRVVLELAEFAVARVQRRLAEVQLALVVVEAEGHGPGPGGVRRALRLVGVAVGVEGRVAHGPVDAALGVEVLHLRLAALAVEVVEGDGLRADAVGLGRAHNLPGLALGVVGGVGRGPNVVADKLAGLDLVAVEVVLVLGHLVPRAGPGVNLLLDKLAVVVVIVDGLAALAGAGGGGG